MAFCSTQPVSLVDKVSVKRFVGTSSQDILLNDFRNTNESNFDMVVMDGNDSTSSSSWTDSSFETFPVLGSSIVVGEVPTPPSPENPKSHQPRATGCAPKSEIHVVADATTTTATHTPPPTTAGAAANDNKTIHSTAILQSHTKKIENTKNDIGNDITEIPAPLLRQPVLIISKDQSKDDDMHANNVEPSNIEMFPESSSSKIMAQQMPNPSGGVDISVECIKENSIEVQGEVPSSNKDRPIVAVLQPIQSLDENQQDHAFVLTPTTTPPRPKAFAAKDNVDNELTMSNDDAKENSNVEHVKKESRLHNANDHLQPMEPTTTSTTNENKLPLENCQKQSLVTTPPKVSTKQQQQPPRKVEPCRSCPTNLGSPMAMGTDKQEASSPPVKEINLLNDSPSKEFAGSSSSCDSSSVGSPGTLMASMEEGCATPKSVQAKRSSKQMTVVVTPEQPAGGIASPVLTNSMCDYILGDAENLSLSASCGGAVLTREMFDYIMGGGTNSDDNTTVTSADLFDEPAQKETHNSNRNVTLKEISVSVPKQDLATSLGHDLSSTAQASENKLLVAKEQDYATQYMASTVILTEKLKSLDEMWSDIAKEEAIPAPPLASSSSFPRSPTKQGVASCEPIRAHSLLPNPDIFVPPPMPTPTKPRRRSSYTNQHPTIYEDSTFEDSSIRSEIVMPVSKPKKLSSPPPSPPPPSTPPPPLSHQWNPSTKRRSPYINENPAMFEPASIEELGVFLPPDIRRVRTGKRRSKKSVGFSSFTIIFTYLFVVCIGLLVAWPKLIENGIITIETNHDKPGNVFPLLFIRQQPPKEPPQPKNPIVKVWKRVFRSRKQQTRKNGR